MINKIILIFFLVPNLYSFSQNNKYDPINTGVNMTVAIMSVDTLCLVGDTILALYTDNGILKYGGQTIWSGSRVAIAIWGDDTTTEEKDGFLNNEHIKWAVLKNDSLFSFSPKYKFGNNLWSPNGISIIDSLTYIY
ncbi:MAG: hypothetical protein CMP65_04750 [Flavobacteriales bacterium]|nr:hypothetical protein [Flavobacteriales bacterium]|tara:strand:+ start:13667 stop:14074 length:408 start_codon:yes stop_codon:yes gene_type:complete